MDLTMRLSSLKDFQPTLMPSGAYEVDKLSGGMISQVRRMAPLIVPVTIHALIASEDIIDAMDLRAFGIGPRMWLEQLHYRRRDYVLIAAGVLILFVSLVLSVFGFGKFWVPEGLLRMFGG
jgi:energy-coupling factor transport system permease protein